MNKDELTIEFLQKEYIELCKPMSQISRETGISVNSIKARIRKYGIKRTSNNSSGRKFRYPIDETKVSIENPEFCYFAGLIATDGHIDSKNGRTHIGVANEGSFEVLEELHRYFNSKCPVKIKNTPTMQKKGAKPLNDTHYYSDVIIECLNKDFCIPSGDKSLIIGFPDFSKFSRECLLMFIRGIIDGDGTINQWGAIHIETGSKEFAEGIKKCIDYLLGEEYTVIADSKGKYYDVRVNSGLSKGLLFEIYDIGYPSLRFKDKYERFYRSYYK